MIGTLKCTMFLLWLLGTPDTFSVPAAPATKGLFDKCPSGWTHHGGSCYKGFTKKVSPDSQPDTWSSTARVQMTWEKARQRCLRADADLASIHSSEEQKKAWGLANGKNTWIGGNDLETEGTFTWSDGTPWDNPLWYTNQPDDASSEQNCVTMWDAGHGQWGDTDCNLRNQFICKRPGQG